MKTMIILREFVFLAMAGWIFADTPTFTMEDMCGERIKLADSKSTSALVSFHHSPSLIGIIRKERCEFVLDTGSWNIDVSWNRLGIEILDFQNNGSSCVSFGKIQPSQRNNWDSATPILGLLDSYCGTSKPPLHTSFILDKYNMLYIKFKASDYVDDGNVFFNLFVNVFHLDGHCSQYKCENGRCIPTDLKCSEYNPCGDHSDCENGAPIPLILGIVAGCIAAIVISVFIVKCWRDRRKWKSEQNEMANMDQVASENTQASSQEREPQQSLLVHIPTVQVDDSGEKSPDANDSMPPPSYEEAILNDMR